MKGMVTPEQTETAAVNANQVKVTAAGLGQSVTEKELGTEAGVPPGMEQHTKRQCRQPGSGGIDRQKEQWQSGGSSATDDRRWHSGQGKQTGNSSSG